MDTTQLWFRYKQQRDAAAREALILQHAYLVRQVAERLGISCSPQFDRDDLISHGVIGLIDAVEKFDPERGPRFEAYACVRIRGAILDAVRHMDWLPRTVRAAANTLEQTAAQFKHDQGREPSVAELAEATGMEEDAIRKVRTHVAQAHMHSLEGVSTANQQDAGYEGLTLMPLDEDVDPSHYTPSERLEQAERREILAQAISGLPADERLVLSLYYFEDLTLKEIGKVMGLTESRISQIRTKAMMRLRAHLRTQSDIFAAA